MSISWLWFFIIGTLSIGISFALLLAVLFLHFGLNARIKPEGISAKVCAKVNTISRSLSERKKQRVAKRRERLNAQNRLK